MDINLTINNKFGISFTANIDDDKNLYNVHFWDSEDTEIDAYVMDDYKEYQTTIMSDIKSYMTIETEEDLAKVIKGLASNFGSDLTFNKPGSSEKIVIQCIE